jgi:cysteine desulfuration protein SufE
MSIEQKQIEIIEEFSSFSDWMEKYEYIIELGKDLEIIQSEFKTDDNLIKGCQSRRVASFGIEAKRHVEFYCR